MPAAGIAQDRAPRLLLIDDDAELCALMSEFLSAQGYEVATAPDGAAGLDAALSSDPDVIILDVMMPRLDGFDLLRNLRRRSQTPVLMLSARTAPEDRIQGLNVGADDYLLKPFVVGELLARIRAVLRRSQRPAVESLTVGSLTLDRSTRSCRNGGTEITLTGTEFDLLELLCESPGVIVSRDAIARTLYGRDTTAYERTIDVHVSHLRKKLQQVDDIRIKTIRGTGYVLVRHT
jgi:two-component system response regulator CpxR